MASSSAGPAGERLPPPIGIASLTYPKGTAADASVASAAAADTAAPQRATPPGAVAPVSLAGHAPERDAEAAEAPSARAQRWPVRFTGSGSEYFRIWIVNLLLIVVTLTLYYPWAKVRKLRYFYGNTRLGEHAFDFHGDPRRMLRGYLLVGALLAVYSAAGKVSPTAGLIALAFVAPLWPLLFRASMRFRLSQTSWRGLRFGFDGDVRGAYLALLPAFVPALLVLVVVALGDDSPASRAAPAPTPAQQTAGLVLLAVMFGSTLLLPWIWWAIKRYQHDHYRFAGDATRLRAGVGSFYRVFGKAALVTLVAGIGAGAAMALLVGAGFVAAPKGRAGGPAMFIVMMLAVLLFYGVLVAIAQPYFASRLQNLIWSRTQGKTVRFASDLRFTPLVRLTLKNWLLMVLTLGLYWPFAAVALARLKLQAVTVTVAPGFEQLVAARQRGDKDATGDLAADVFGIDVGL